MEEAAPLLLLPPKKKSEGEAPEADGGRPSAEHQTSDRRAPAIILGFECLESLGFYGVATNLVVYLRDVIGQSNAAAASSMTTFTGTCFLAPVLGAVLADSYCGSYAMVLASSSMDLLGMVLVALSASFSSPATAATARKVAFYSGLCLVAVGSGGIKSSLIPLGADQLGDDDRRPEEGGIGRTSFFNWFYFFMNTGSLVAGTLVVWIQENVGWFHGFALSALCMATAVGAFVCGRSTYRLQKPKGSPVGRAAQVVAASVAKMNAALPSDSRLLYETAGVPGEERLEHTGDFRFLDKAAVILDSDAKSGGIRRRPWRLCPVTQVEELKVILRLLPIWLTSIPFSVAYSQMYTTFVEQARAMDTSVGSLRVPPASLYAFEVLSVMFWVLAYDVLVAPAARAAAGGRRGLSQLQRMGVGYFLMILAMGAAAAVEGGRRDRAKRGGVTSFAWQLPQYFLVGGSEVFMFVGQMEFLCGEAPIGMRSMCTSLTFLALSLGSYLNSVLLAAAAAATSTEGDAGWMPEDLNEGRLDCFFWALAGFCAASLIAHTVCAARYKPKRIACRAVLCEGALC